MTVPRPDGVVVLKEKKTSWVFLKRQYHLMFHQ